MEKNSPVSSLRADAARNRERILRAAAEVIADRGPDAPLDEIARRAKVGNATLYRRFPERAALIRAVAMDVMTRSTEVARAALAEEPDAFAALARYMRDALDNRVGAVMPMVAQALDWSDPEVRRVRDDGAAKLAEILKRARADGALRPDIDFGDIGPMLTRLSRPMPNSLPDELDRELGQRQLQVVLDGLRAAPGQAPLPGPSLGLRELRDRRGRTAKKPPKNKH